MGAVPDVPGVLTERFAALDVVLDPERMRARLEAVARARFGAAAVDAIDLEVFRRHYNRWVVRYDVVLRGAGGETRAWSVIGKVIPRAAGERLDRHMRRLVEAGFDRDPADGIAIPEPLAWIRELELHLQECIPGESVRDRLKRAPDPAAFRLAGAALAKLHRSRAYLGVARTLDDHLERCHPRHPVLSAVAPAWADSVARIVEGARAAIARLGPTPVTPVHGDFHLGQVHVDGERAWLVDLDAAGMADPASDLGNLLVFLEDKARRRPEVAHLAAAFLDRYAEAGGDADVMPRVPLYRALTHLRRACKVLRLAKPGHEARIDRMLSAGVEAIRAMERRLA